MSRSSVTTGLAVSLVLLGTACGKPTDDTHVFWDPAAPGSLRTDQNSATGNDASVAAPVTGPGSSSSADGGAQSGEPGEPVSTGLDAGVEAPSDPADDPIFKGPVVCSSGTYWTGEGGEEEEEGEEGSELMDPGQACVACHREEREGPIYSIAGTVYLTGHEPDDCYGVNGDESEVQVELVDATGKVVRLTPNAAGNFFTEDALRFPVLTKVLYQGRERVMDGEINAADGDCNTCHTSEGTEDAPGRIALP